ncbi:Protein-ribulosamine 3-kinase, chloroplastic [Dendrobium catenatum]|uniref:protein-ribulosamine 3-kinase n=2 Tax=Dendrobium catenatum TaxID=906689 RepID=A0A2I0W949_9ASPA|nr:Protein-ribulosamine 3-kinase, chloroplastic [Dendrobium catenatum]
MSAAFIVFICARLICGRNRSSDAQSTAFEIQFRSDHGLVRFLSSAYQLCVLESIPAILPEHEDTHIMYVSTYDRKCINSATNRQISSQGSFLVMLGLIPNSKIIPSDFCKEVEQLQIMFFSAEWRVQAIKCTGNFMLGARRYFLIVGVVDFGAISQCLFAINAFFDESLVKYNFVGSDERFYTFCRMGPFGSSLELGSFLHFVILFFRTFRYFFKWKHISIRYAIPSIYESRQLTKNMKPLFEGIVIEPCLLHGDLWSGNISSDKNGEPVILDPACYYGHNEAEFGMSWCAGFSGSFYNSYFQVMPKQPGFENRRDIYMLYHYLNHYNLFGYGYRSSAMSIIDNYLRILKA